MLRNWFKGSSRPADKETAKINTKRCENMGGELFANFSSLISRLGEEARIKFNLVKNWLVLKKQQFYFFGPNASKLLNTVTVRPGGAEKTLRSSCLPSTQSLIKNKILHFMHFRPKQACARFNQGSLLWQRIRTIIRQQAEKRLQWVSQLLGWHFRFPRMFEEGQPWIGSPLT